MTLATATARLIAESRNLHALQGTCSHPKSCPMWCAILDAEAALAGYEFESAEVPAHVFEDGDRLCVQCGARLPEGATGNSCGRCL